MTSYRKDIVTFPEKPEPDFDRLIGVLTGQKKPSKVHLVEWFVDYEVIDFIMKYQFQDEGEPLRKMLDVGENDQITFLNSEKDRVFVDRLVKFYYLAGYDSFVDHIPLNRLVSRVLKPRLPNLRSAPDTAALSRGTRVFAEEGQGIIQSWEDFERFPWTDISIQLEGYYAYLSERLPVGMKIMVGGSFFEQVLEYLFGYEGLFYLLFDQVELVEAVFNQYGELVHKIYSSVIEYDQVGGIFHADDLGFKTSTMLSPADLERFVFPWYRRFSSLAHDNGKMFWYHSCGNLAEVYDTLIDDIQIDAYHSFQDAILPVGDFKRKYGHRVGTLGGIDVDKLSRLDEQGIRAYVRNILAECMPGRFALSSGNSVPNYAPVENYLAMLDEAYKWGNSW